MKFQALAPSDSSPAHESVRSLEPEPESIGCTPALASVLEQVPLTEARRQED